MKVNFSRDSLRKIFFQLQDSCLAYCNFLQDKTKFCRTVLYVIIVILVIFAGYLFDRLKHFVRLNEILLVLTERLALFVKTAFKCQTLNGVTVLMVFKDENFTFNVRLC